MPLLLTWQAASAFNQPLSLNTSKVTNMGSMFHVRSARALRPPGLESGLPRACRLRRRRPTLEHYELRNELRYEKGIRNEKRAS
jgi:hypothetical protein